MKRHILPCCVLLLLFSVFSNRGIVEAASERNTTVSVNEGGFSIEVPYDCHILQQNIDDDDPYIEKMGAKKEQVEDYYRQSGIVLHVIAPDNTYEMVVTMTHNQSVKYIYNLKSLSDGILHDLQDTVYQSYLTYGYQMKETDFYENDQMKYMIFHFGQSVDDKNIDCLQYYMIKGSKVYNFTMRYYGNQMPEELKLGMRNMIDSIQFSNKEWINSYEDKESGVSFQIKDGWDKVSTGDTGSTVKAQFLHTNGLGESIQFLTLDLWNQMDTLHQLVKSRDKICMQGDLKNPDMQAYAEKLRGYLGDADNISMIQIGDLWYFMSDNPIKLEEHQAQGVYLQKNAVTIKNGLAYIYQYGYFEGNNIHESDFEQLLNEITYSEPDLKIRDAQGLEKIKTLKYGMIAVIVLAIGVLILVSYMYFFGSEKGEEK